MHKLKQLLPQQLKNLYHLAQAILANVFYGFPSQKIKVIGITGSDGKTTTTQMVAKILEGAGKKVAMASTINFVIDGKEEKNLSHYTTESSFAVQKFIKKALDAGCEYLVLETSSHALDQYRVWGVNFQTAVITNITREHLDYHKTMERYRKAKTKLFEIVAKNKGVFVINADMEKPQDYLIFAKTNSFAYSVCKENIDVDCKLIRAENIELAINGSAFDVRSADGAARFALNLPGGFNIENALAATCVGLTEGISLETIKEALAKITGIPGRLESVPNERGLNILVDFALTPNALEKLYSLLVGVKKEGSKVIAIFGSCGDRDKGKRPIMGEVVSRYADQIILTNEEPYHEQPERIIDEIAVGIKNKVENQNFWKIIDRRQAIKKALEIAKPDDIIVVTGMGNFESMVVGDEKIPWNDKNVIEEELIRAAS
jgi:UDP-N-acetylmuramoyl-L-alanyl-D-glutamate--2,6-diaminopimelate ligase